MPKFSAQTSQLINAPADKIYKVITDFGQWTVWSPWLIMEPEATVEVAENNKSYSWEGKRVGSGKMKITDEDPNKAFDSDLNFIKPWKSYAKIRFELDPMDEGTKVTWIMHSSLPFFMFWMKKMMISFMEMDFSRGLNMLKDYLEDGKVHSQLEFSGQSQFPGAKYIGVKNNCTIATVGETMTTDFEKLWEYMEDRSDKVAGKGLSIYHKWDLKNKQVAYTAGIQISDVPQDLPDGAFIGEIPATKIYTVKHTGPYLHLGNAWGTMMNLQRSKVFKAQKGIHPFETYENLPGEVPDTELVTHVNFACK